jgi:diguanylate cyclase (GGDEF)-like protein
MYHMKGNRNYFFTKTDRKFIEMNSLLSAIITPIFAFFWLKLNPEMAEHLKWAFKLFSALFFFLYCSMYISSFIRRNLEYFIEATYFLVSAFAIYLAYYYNFSQSYSLVLLMVVFYLALTFNKMSTLLYYLMTVLVLIGFAVYLERSYKNIYNQNGLVISMCLMVSFVIAIYNLYIRNRDKRALNEMALFDSVTKLPNRHFLYKFLNESIGSTVTIERPAAIMFIDLDKFKFINDTMGHNFGDAVLQQASLEIQKCLLKNDFISRHGGDEFIVVLWNAGLDRAELTAQQMIQRFTDPLRVGEHSIDLTLSIGLSCYPLNSSNVETLIQYADIAMYEAKSQGRNQFLIYHPNMSDDISRKNQLERGLKRAIQNDEFFLYYQPQIDFITGEILGVEALIRWMHPEFGIVPPSEFIPLAEDTGLIVPIGEWVLKTACFQCKKWQISGFPPIHLAVNVSYQQLKNKDFIDTIQSTLIESGLNPQYLELEITESVLRDAKELKIVLDELKPIGIKLAIDDFGVGYSSLSMLQHVNIENLKIDRSLISDITKSPKAAAIAKTIIEMGKNLNCKITAEGVETKEQFHFLKDNNCHYGQGYYFSRPLNVPDIEKLLREWNKI